MHTYKLALGLKPSAQPAQTFLFVLMSGAFHIKHSNVQVSSFFSIFVNFSTLIGEQLRQMK